MGEDNTAMQVRMYALMLLVQALCVATSPSEPKGKALVSAMDTVIGHQTQWNNWTAWNGTMSTFFAQDFTYDFACPNCTYNSIRNWYLGEHIPWNTAFPHTTFAGTTGIIFAGNNKYVTLITYAQATFANDFTPGGGAGSIPATHGPVTISDLDFYVLNDDGKIQWNGCMADIYGIMVQAGYRMLPKPVLPEGRLYAPRNMAGIPGPVSAYVNQDDTAPSHAVMMAALEQDWVVGSTALKHWSADAAFFGSYGIGMAKNSALFIQHVQQPFVSAFANRSVEIDVTVCEGKVCGAHGHIKGLHVAPWLGQPPVSPPREVRVRFGMHWNLDEDFQVLDHYATFDLVTAMLEMGRDLFAEIRPNSTD